MIDREIYCISREIEIEGERFIEIESRDGGSRYR